MLVSFYRNIHIQIANRDVPFPVPVTLAPELSERKFIIITGRSFQRRGRKERGVYAECLIKTSARPLRPLRSLRLNHRFGLVTNAQCIHDPSNQLFQREYDFDGSAFLVIIAPHGGAFLWYHWRSQWFKPIN